jgi:hypothetical protein
LWTKTRFSVDWNSEMTFFPLKKQQPYYRGNMIFLLGSDNHYQVDQGQIDFLTFWSTVELLGYSQMQKLFNLGLSFFLLFTFLSIIKLLNYL